MRTSWGKNTGSAANCYAHSSSRPTALQYRFLRSCRKFSESKRCPSSYYSEYLLGKPGNITSISQFVALGNAVTRLWGGLLWTRGGAEGKSALPLISFLSPCSPTSYWKSLAPDRSDDEHDLLDGTSRPRYSHNYLSDSDTEAKQTETNA